MARSLDMCFLRYANRHGEKQSAVIPLSLLAFRRELKVGLFLKPGPHQQQCRSNIVEAIGNFVACCFDNVAVLATKSNVASTSSPKRQECRSNVRLYSIRQCCFDIVAGVDRV